MNAARQWRGQRLAPGMLAFALTAAVLSVWNPAAAAGATVCVACAEPQRTYRCEVLAEPGENVRIAPLLCAARIAQDNGHNSCAVSQSVKSCDGVVKTFRLSDLTQQNAPGAPAAVSPAAPRTLAAPQPPVSDATAPRTDETADGEPATVADMTKDTLDTSRENMRKAGEAINNAGERAQGAISGAGEAVGNAARRTWSCLGGGDC